MEAISKRIVDAVKHRTPAALELLEHMLEHSLRRVVVPLMDGKVKLVTKDGEIFGGKLDRERETVEAAAEPFQRGAAIGQSSAAATGQLRRQRLHQLLRY